MLEGGNAIDAMIGWIIWLLFFIKNNDLSGQYAIYNIDK